jgi:hypothetical protein
LESAVDGNSPDVRVHGRSTLLAIAALGAVAALASGPRSAAAGAGAPCWQRVITDWADNGTIDGTYAATCYRAAMANAPTDLRIYSTIEDDLRLALQSRTLRRVSVDTLRRPAAHAATLERSSTSPMVAALGAGLGILGAAISTALVLARRRRRRTI